MSCEVGVWNWLAKHLIAQGIAERTALNILSLGFALGLLIGRVVVSRILIKVPAATVTLVAAVLMAITTYGMLQSTDPGIAAILVFFAGVAMAPVFPTTLAMVGDAFPRMTATAMGIAITSGWIGLAVSSRVIGAIAGTGSHAHQDGAAGAAGVLGGHDYRESGRAADAQGEAASGSLTEVRGLAY